MFGLRTDNSSILGANEELNIGSCLAPMRLPIVTSEGTLSMATVSDEPVHLDLNWNSDRLRIDSTSGSRSIGLGTSYVARCSPKIELGRRRRVVTKGKSGPALANGKNVANAVPHRC